MAYGPFPVPDRSYQGDGTILLRRAGTTDPFRAVGNCSKVALAVKEAVTKLKNYMGGGGTRNAIKKIDEVTISIETSDWSVENLGAALYGTPTALAGGISTEVVTVAHGGLVPLSYLGATDATVTDAGTGDHLTTGFELRPSGIYFPADSALTEGQSIEVEYSYPAQDVIKSLTAINRPFEILFEGLNGALEGSPVSVRAWRALFSPTAGLDLISDSHGKLTLTADLLADASRGEGESQFFQVQAVRPS